MNPFRWSFRSQFLLGFAVCAALLAYAFYVQSLPPRWVRATQGAIPGCS